MRLVVDASVFVAEQIEEQPEFPAAAAFFSHCVKQGVQLYAPVIVLAEVAGAIARITQNSGLGTLAITRLGQFPRLALRQMDVAFGEAAARAAARWFLRGADSCYAALARELKCPLITGDDELLTRCPPTMKVMRPEQWLNQMA